MKAWRSVDVAKTDLFGHAITTARQDRERALEQRRRARLTTARLARDHEDCALLLTMLGLMPGQEPGALDVNV